MEPRVAKPDPRAALGGGRERDGSVEPAVAPEATAAPENAVREYFSKLVVRDLPLGSMLSQADLEYLAGWMAHDPLLRTLALRYLERAPR